MRSPSTFCPSKSIGSRSARATSPQNVSDTAFGVSPSWCSADRSAAHCVHRAKAGSASVAHTWIMPRQIFCGSTPLSSTKRSVRSGNICEYTAPR